MKIASSNVAMEGASQKTSTHKVNQRLEIRQGASTQELVLESGTHTEENAFSVDLQSSQKEAQQAWEDQLKEQAVAQPKTLAAGAKFSVPDKNAMRIRLLELMLYYMSGKRTRLFDPSDLERSQSTNANTLSGWFGGNARNVQFGLSYDYQEVRMESEAVRFQAGGTVQTEDGQTISFDIELLMSRAYYEESSFQMRIGNTGEQVCDPLVIAYGGGAPSLSAERFGFDLTMDGVEEQIAFATNGSGFLALDKNGDGMINDGSELFGPQSGNGFLELAAYDFDGNCWIDENDPVFSQLSVLTLDQDGNRVLFSLKELGVGAIYLNTVDTQYEMKDAQGMQGQMRTTSVFLKENGEAGTIHHIDLAI